MQLTHTGLAIGWVYQHKNVKNSAKVTLLNFNRTAVFLYDVMVLENAVLEARLCSWCVCMGNFDLRL